MLSYVSRGALPLKGLIFYIYRSRGTMQYNQQTIHTQSIPLTIMLGIVNSKWCVLCSWISCELWLQKAVNLGCSELGVQCYKSYSFLGGIWCPLLVVAWYEPDAGWVHTLHSWNSLWPTSLVSSTPKTIGTTVIPDCWKDATLKNDYLSWNCKLAWKGFKDQSLQKIMSPAM
jgi:hypothetical protein